MRLRSALVTLVVLGAALSVGTARNSLAALQRSSQHGQATLEATSDGASAHALSLRLCGSRTHRLGQLLTLRCTGTASGAVYMVEGTKNGVFTFVERVRPGTPGAQPQYAGSPPPHIHERQEETFVVLAGTMGYMLDGKHGTVPTGKSVTVPRGLPHFFYNADDRSELRVRISLAPAGAAQSFFENLAGLSRDYGTVERVPLLQLLTLFVAGDVDLAAPAPVRAAIRLLAPPLAALHGYQPAYPEYATQG